MSFVYYTVICIALTLIWCWLNRKSRKEHPSGLPLPPGPKFGFPILGHLPLLGNEPYKNLMKFKKDYGPICSLKFGAYNAVVIQDEAALKEIFSQYAASDRLHVTVAREMSCGYKGVVGAHAQAALEQRPFIMRQFRELGYGKSSMEEKILDQVKGFMEDLKKEVKGGNTDGIEFNHRFTANVLNSIWSIMTGKTFARGDPQLQKLIDHATMGIKPAGALGEIATFLPWLEAMLPLSWLGLDKKIGGWLGLHKFAQNEIDKHKKDWVKGQPRDFTDNYLDKVAETTDVNSTFYESHNFQSIVTGDILIASLETVSSALEWLIVHLVRNPQVQQRVYDEASLVTNSNLRQVRLEDRPKMPYTDAVTHELLRASTISPMGVPHWTNEDVFIREYVIPKGTILIGNYYGVHMDDQVHENPSEFRPERFINKETGKYQKCYGFAPFSIGRRSCIGQTQAMDSLFLYTANLVHRFRFQVWNNQVPSTEGVPGLSLPPQKYKVKVTLRE